mgnify:FL=1
MESNIINKKSISFLLMLLAWSSLQIPSLRSIFKYSGNYLFIILFIFFLFSISSLIIFIKKRGFFIFLSKSNWPWLTMMVVITIIVYYIYPIADGLKSNNGGSDQDDGLIQGAIAILEGISPYSVTSYLGNPISAGPGWIILLLPLSAFNLYWVITPLSLLILIYSNYISGRSIYYTNILICLLCSSLAFWEILVVGSDFIAFSALLVALGNLIVRFKDNIFILMLIAFVVGMFSTARIFFIVI